MTEHKSESKKTPADAETQRTINSNEGARENAPPPRAADPPRAIATWKLFLFLLFGVHMIAAGMIWANPLRAGIGRAWSLAQIAVSNVIRGTDSTLYDPGVDAEAQEDSLTFFTCGMHPWVILPDPGLCPICHMDLTPLDPSKFSSEISIDPIIVQNMGVRIDQVVTGPLVRSIRTVGTIDYDETGVRDVNLKVSGWIEKLHVDYLGAQVQAGDPLFDLYSRELYVAQQEYLLSYRNQSTPAGDLPGAEAAEQRRSVMLEADQKRLAYLDVTPQQIRELEEAGEPSKTMTIASPYTGVVIAKHANEGMNVTPGMRVYRIADLSKVWVMVTLYEFQQPYVTVGQEATMSLPYIPGQVFVGKVIYIYPYLEEQTRQIKVRLEFDNPGGFLKPGMFADIKLRGQLAAQRTLVPRSAVIDTGERQVAIVSLGEGRFEPRDVVLGVEADNNMVEVIDGLKPGEMVVTSGQFLLDSEANMREGLAKLIRGNLAADQEAVVAVAAGASELRELPAQVAESLTRVITAYFTIGDRLAADSTAGLDKPARAIAAGVDELLAIEISAAPHFWHEHEEIATVRGKAIELSSTGELDAARLSFADLSVALAKLVKATGIPPGLEYQVQELHCPMFREGQGGSTWLQAEGDVRNPFFGSVMLECFDARYTLPVTGSVAESAKNGREAQP